MTQERMEPVEIRPLQRESTPVHSKISLSPSQQHAYKGLLHCLPLSNVFVLWGGVGRGKSTVLRAVHQATGGAFLTMKEVLDALQGQNPMAVEETFERLMMHTLKTHDVVIL